MKSIFVFAILLTSILAFADKDRGGGDPCEARIKEIREDLKAWILSGGSKKLVLPTGITHDQYSTAMLNQISAARIRCVGPRDAGYPVHVDQTPKVCRFDRTSRESLITCDRDQFLSLVNVSPSEQYVLIHHEYAGLAGIESPRGDDSVYAVSSQLSDQMGAQLVQRLNVTSADSKQFPGWRELDGLDGVLASKKLYQLLSQTQFRNCSMEVQWTNESSYQRTCENQSYRNPLYLISPFPNSLQEAPLRVWANYFSCNSRNGRSDVYLLIQDDTAKTKIRQFSKSTHYPLIDDFVDQDIVYELNATATQIESMTLTLGGGANKKVICLAN